MINFNDIPQFTESGQWECSYSFKSLLEFIDEEVSERGLQLNPDFQRGRVWSNEQSSKYIEFVLQGGRTANIIYLNNPSWHTVVDIDDNRYNDFVCVDGLQRLTSIRQFMNNEIKVFDNYYKDFTGTNRMRMLNLRVNVNDLKTREQVLRWYLEMNSGGVVHTKEEIDKVKRLLDEELKVNSK